MPQYPSRPRSSSTCSTRPRGGAIVSQKAAAPVRGGQRRTQRVTATARSESSPITPAHETTVGRVTNRWTRRFPGQVSASATTLASSAARRTARGRSSLSAATNDRGALSTIGNPSSLAAATASSASAQTMPSGGASRTSAATSPSRTLSRAASTTSRRGSATSMWASSRSRFREMVQTATSLLGIKMSYSSPLMSLTRVERNPSGSVAGCGAVWRRSHDMDQCTAAGRRPATPPTP